ncbi:MAG: hypothetical protein K9G58_03720 [Bacteroidales bacterium]|nr:hypothetical protein [Bacteroidales bacterium]MCF8386730.1 hypothetical protein [Bacteroidales bacterium]MCF8397252.1 hypothetical protein [Bacteroidales bacterium]
MRKLLLFTWVIFFIVPLNAQTQKENLAIDKFGWDENIPAEVGQKLREAVYNAFIKTNRFNVIEKKVMEDALENALAQKENDTLEVNTFSRYEVLKSLGADYIIKGDITGIITDSKNVTSKQIGGGERTYTQYQVGMQFVITAINVADSSIIGTEVIKETGYSEKSYNEALLDYLKSLDYKVEIFIQRYFPLDILLVEITDEKRDKAREVLIAAGEKFGINKGDKFKVVEVSILAGMRREKEIGKVTVLNVEGENFSNCKVNDGEKEIFQSFEAGKELICISLEDSGAKKLIKELGF